MPAGNNPGAMSSRFVPYVILLGLMLCGCHAQRLEADASSVRGVEAGLFFPHDYDDSRTRFRRQCSESKALGPRGCRRWRLDDERESDLTIDYALFGANGTRLIVVQSGLHGSEAPAGAAIQLFMLQNHVEHLVASGIDVLLIHAVNPWGFRHVRRTDSANVNLNRNFSIDGSLFQTKNSNYTRLRQLFEPSGRVRSPRIEQLLIEWRILRQFFADGFDATSINHGFDEGQYEFPTGINFGGYGPRPQTSFLRSELTALFSKPYRSILFFDVHTGLGPDGVLSIIEGKEPPRVLRDRFVDLVREVLDDRIVMRTGYSPGFFPTSGDVIDFVPSLSRTPDRVLALTLEYGTLGDDTSAQIDSVGRIIMENRAQLHGCETIEACVHVRERFRDMFNPDRSGWRTQVIRSADRILTVLRQGF